MLLYVIASVIGVLAGVLTGLTPGIHPNTVIFSSMPFYLMSDLDFMLYMCFITGLSVSHTFHDFIPALFLSAPEAEAALAALPGAQMVLDGRGIEAFQYTLVGGLISFLTVAVVAMVLVKALPVIYKVLEPFLGYILMFFLFFIVFRANKLKISFLVALFSGALGLVSLQMTVNQNYVLMPVFAGLFAVPSILNMLSLEADIPDQRYSEPQMFDAVSGGFIGALSGFIAGIVPGIGAATSTSFLAPIIDSRKQFLSAMGGVNTADILVSFVALYAAGSSRSGASVALQTLAKVQAEQIMLLAAVTVFAVGLTVPIALRTSIFSVKLISRVNLHTVLLVVLAVVLVSNIYLTGLQGALILSTASAIGGLAVLSSERSSCMAVLIVPAIFFYTPFLSL